MRAPAHAGDAVYGVIVVSRFSADSEKPPFV